jgi:hypothetical protein
VKSCLDAIQARTGSGFKVRVGVIQDFAFAAKRFAWDTRQLKIKCCADMFFRIGYNGGEDVGSANAFVMRL